MQVVAICEMFGWTYEQYYDQPQHFLELIRDKMRVDGKRAEQAAKSRKL